MSPAMRTRSTTDPIQRRSRPMFAMRNGHEPRSEWLGPLLRRAKQSDGALRQGAQKRLASQHCTHITLTHRLALSSVNNIGSSHERFARRRRRRPKHRLIQRHRALRDEEFANVCVVATAPLLSNGVGRK
jgi:hypothetical protein